MRRVVASSAGRRFLPEPGQTPRLEIGLRQGRDAAERDDAAVEAVRRWLDDVPRAVVHADQNRRRRHERKLQRYELPPSHAGRLQLNDGMFWPPNDGELPGPY